MEYTEKELLEKLSADLKRPDLLYEKDYIREDGKTSDTEKLFSEVVGEYLLSHRELLAREELHWGLYHNSFGRASERGARTAEKILAQKNFFRAIALDGDLKILDGTTKEVGHFDFMTLDKEGKGLTLFEMQSYPLRESPLSRILRLWMLKESIQKGKLLEMLGLTAQPRISVVTLVTGAPNDRYGSGREEEPWQVKRLGMLLGVSMLYLFHGVHGTVVNRLMPAPSQMTKRELLTKLEKDAAHPELLYQKDYVNSFAITSDTGETVCAVISSWLTDHRDIWMAVPRGLYRLMEGNRMDLTDKDPYFQKIRKQKVLPPFGKVLPVGLVFLGNRSQQLGRPALLTYDGREKGPAPYSMVRAVEKVDSSDALLRSVLRAFTHLLLVNREKLMQDLKLPADTTLEVRLLVEKGTPQYELFLRDLPAMEPLMKAMGVGLMVLEEDYEAMY